MIIKIIPESQEEAKRIKTTEHSGVTEFFMFGVGKDEEGEFADFHDWKGGYRYLLGSIAYFKEIITAEMNAKKGTPQFDPSALRVLPPPEPTTLPEDEGIPEEPDLEAGSPVKGLKVVRAEVEQPEVEVIDVPEPGHDLEENKE